MSDERRSVTRQAVDARSRLVPAGCALALLGVTVALITAVVIPGAQTFFGQNAGIARATSTPNLGPSDLAYELVLPTPPATTVKISRTPALPNDANFATLGKAKMQNTCAVATPPATTPVTTTTPSGVSAAATATVGLAGPTATPLPTATTAPSPTATTGLAGSGTPTTTVTCATCPVYLGNNPDQTTIAAALAAAALKYGLPENLLKGVAWQESRWHEDVLSCDGGIGLMQIQYYTYPWLNSVAEPACDLVATTDDPYTLAGNADLGAKYLKWLSCFYSYWGDNGGASATNPGSYTIASYYQQAGLQYPDSFTASGAVNPKSFCAAVYNDPNHPEYAALPSTTKDVWSCPYSATTGDNTLLDMMLSAYNEGAGYTDQYGIQNPWYVSGVEGWIPQFASGALPTAS